MFTDLGRFLVSLLGFSIVFVGMLLLQFEIHDCLAVSSMAFVINYLWDWLKDS